MSLPAFLVPETVVEANGASDPIALFSKHPVLVTLGILESVEQQSLLLAIEGSEDGVTWLLDALVTFPEKFYPEVSAVYVDPAPKNVQHLRATWKVNRWGRGSKTPRYKLYLFVEELAE